MEFLRKNWLTLLLIVAIVGGFLWMRSQQADWAQAIKDMNDSHQVEIRKINEARAQEAKEHAEQLRQLQESVTKIEADYAKALAELEKEREDRKKQIVKNYGDKPDDLAALLANQFGFVVKPVQ